ncbi:hypothetical protein L210DRAFT_3567862 [Boletus edulis BED1]|uniref:Uncharacterized protein n=1 Tax=Boletus edulis BED1 TaxID=1328754 RepID=A0AAD4BF12_BOLED|nr:hypothetical protein L210DRAFT_3567862 [Boletus edulis BED1]
MPWPPFTHRRIHTHTHSQAHVWGGERTSDECAIDNAYMFPLRILVNLLSLSCRNGTTEIWT